MKKINFNEYKMVMETYNESNVAFANLIWENNDTEDSFKQKVVDFVDENLSDYRYAEDFNLDSVNLRSKGEGIYDIWCIDGGDWTIEKIETIIEIEMDDRNLDASWDIDSKARCERAKWILFVNGFLSDLETVKSNILEAIHESIDDLSKVSPEEAEEDEIDVEGLIWILNKLNDNITNASNIREIDDILESLDGNDACQIGINRDAIFYN